MAEAPEPSAPASLILRYFAVVNRNSTNAYDGSIVDDGQGTSTTDRYARQQGVFSHLLNFYNTAGQPAGTWAAGDVRRARRLCPRGVPHAGLTRWIDAAFSACGA